MIAHISRNNFGFHLIAKVEQWALCEIIPWIESLMQVVRIDTMKISTIVQINLSIRQVMFCSTSFLLDDKVSHTIDGIRDLFGITSQSYLISLRNTLIGIVTVSPIKLTRHLRLHLV